MDAEAINDLIDLLHTLRDSIDEGIQTLRDIEHFVDPNLAGMDVPTVEDAQRVMKLVDQLGVIEDMGSVGEEVDRTIQEFYAAAEVDLGEALEREVRDVVVSFITDKTGELGIAERIADEVEKSNALGE